MVLVQLMPIKLELSQSKVEYFCFTRSKLQIIEGELFNKKQLSLQIKKNTKGG